MLSTNDPIRRLRLQIRWTIAIGSIAVIALLVFALRPLSSASLPEMHIAQPTESSSQLPEENNTTEIDPNAFKVTLWHTKEESQSDPNLEAIELAKVTKTKPLNLQLVAIIEEKNTLQAAFYDQEEDTIIILANGAMIRDRQLHITSEFVEFMTMEGKADEKLLLYPDQPRVTSWRDRF